ncbi:large ribosomal subunit protein uL10m [Palaemon carinicauda]|uniref:large ribosomal subunit protein uL10m n=1 Tax=Palaemon carinicauda TaxID=392227 RepID=UPI0035B68046
MALRGFGQLFRTNFGFPLLQTVRHRTRKPNLRHPPIPHWRRAVILELSKPKYKDPLENVPAICKNKEAFLRKAEVKDNPFEIILAKEFFQKVEESNVLAVFHCNPMTAAELFANRVQLSKVGLFYHHCNNKIAELAFTNTKYEAVLDLYKTRNATFIGTEVNVPKLLKMMKRMRGLVLLAGVVEGRLMSIRDMERYAALPPLPVLHGQLVGILQSPLQKLSQNLTYHQTELSAALGRYVSDQTKTPEKESQERAIEPDAS